MLLAAVFIAGMSDLTLLALTFIVTLGDIGWKRTTITGVAIGVASIFLFSKAVHDVREFPRDAPVRYLQIVDSGTHGVMKSPNRFILEASVGYVESDAQVRARERAIEDFRAQNQTSPLDAIAAGKNLWADMSLVRHFERTSFRRDELFTLDEKKLGDLSADVERRFWTIFVDAESEIHAQVLRAHALELSWSYRALANSDVHDMSKDIAPQIWCVMLAVGVSRAWFVHATRRFIANSVKTLAAPKSSRP